MTAPIVTHTHREPYATTEASVYAASKAIPLVREVHPDTWSSAGQLWDRAAEGPNAAKSDKVTASQMDGILDAWIQAGGYAAVGSAARGHAVHDGCPQASGVIHAGEQVK